MSTRYLDEYELTKAAEAEREVEEAVAEVNEHRRRFRLRRGA